MSQRLPTRSIKSSVDDKIQETKGAFHLLIVTKQKKGICQLTANMNKWRISTCFWRKRIFFQQARVLIVLWENTSTSTSYSVAFRSFAPQAHCIWGTFFPPKVSGQTPNAVTILYDDLGDVYSWSHMGVPALCNGGQKGVMMWQSILKKFPGPSGAFGGLKKTRLACVHHLSWSRIKWTQKSKIIDFLVRKCKFRKSAVWQSQKGL